MERERTKMRAGEKDKKKNVQKQNPKEEFNVAKAKTGRSIKIGIRLNFT